MIMYTEGIRLVLNDQKTSEGVSKPDRLKKSEKWSRLAEVHKIFTIEKMPVYVVG